MRLSVCFKYGGERCSTGGIKRGRLDIAHSLKQINGALEQFKDFFKTTAHVYGRVVVTSSTPNLKASPSYVNLRKRLEKEFHGNLKIAEKQLTEKDVDLAKI